MSIFQSLFGGGSQELVGLDISSSAVKLLELSRRGDRFHVETYAVEPLPPNAVNEKLITDPKLVAEAIGRAVNRAGTRTKNVALAVAGASVITKVVQMSSALSEHDMEEQIRAQADQYIPYPIEDVNLDFQVLGTSDKGSANADVLLAACRREQVDSRCAAAELAGLVPKVVDIEAYALENACQFLRHQMPGKGVKKTVAVVDVGASTTSLLVLHDLQTVYTRDQAFGGKTLTEEIMRQYGLSFEEAGKAKKFGNLPESYESEVLPSFIADLGQQIDRSLQFFFAASSKHGSMDQVILAGGCAHIPGVDALVQERLGIPTVVARPFSAMTVAAKARPSVLAKDEAAMLIAAGLAYRAFDTEV
ncbi:pilus assembly protein PilM [Panacagrimonas sp.]|uniref:pilus assembly protein PilM n=1 Tax=Panacagrimonas sp. TaxID=2480088 RepID=UPI003B52CACE